MSDASKMPSLATSISGPGGKARVAMKRAIVKPMPATRPTTRTSDHRTPDGSAAARARTASQEKHITPIGLPTTRPTITPINTVAPSPLETCVPEGHTGVRQREQGHDRERHPAMEGTLEPFDR